MGLPRSDGSRSKDEGLIDAATHDETSHHALKDFAKEGNDEKEDEDDFEGFAEEADEEMSSDEEMALLDGSEDQESDSRGGGATLDTQLLLD